MISQLLNKLKIKLKLISAFTFVILIFGVVIGLYQFTVSKTIEGYNLAINAPIKAAFHMDEAKMAILQASLSKEQYINTKDRAFVDAIKSNVGKANNEMKVVREIAKIANRFDLMEVFDKIDNMHAEFESAFEELNAALNQSDSMDNADRDRLFTRTLEQSAAIEELILTIQSEARKDAVKFARMTDEKVAGLANTAKITAVVIGVVGLLISWFISNSIANPIIKTALFAEKISEKDFTDRLDIRQKDEIGLLADALNSMRENLVAIITDLRNASSNLTNSSSELSQISSQMASRSQDSSQRAGNVSAATEEMTTNIGAVAAAMEESSTNINIVATGAEEMTATISEIAKNAEEARSISDNAVNRSQSAGEKMTELGNAAQAINKVNETITEISEQTNLLALNATIEAARAGEAGKGFAVVANEIKELAKQTAEATQDIKTKIDGVQVTTSGTITEIEQVTEVINSVNEVVGAIATAVEQQSVATKEIAANISQASRGIQEVNMNVGQSSSAAQSITEDIAMVSSQTQDTVNSSEQVKLSANDLEQMSVELNRIVDQFKI